MRVGMLVGVPMGVCVCVCVSYRWFVTATIIGATSVDQLKENIAAFDKKLSPECLAEIEEVFKVGVCVCVCVPHMHVCVHLFYWVADGED